MRLAALSMPFDGAAVNWKVVAGLGLAASIAWLAPFDPAFDAMTLGAPALRSVSIVAIALIGWGVSGKIGLGIEPRGLKRPILTPILAAAVVGVGCMLFDRLMQPALQGHYVRLISSTPLAVRITGYMLRAFNENIMYRLFLGSVLVWLIGRVWKTPEGRPATGAYWTGFALSHALNIWINVTGLAPLTPIALLHDILRYFMPGMVWSWLYWRHGFQSNEIASTSVHLFFQPLAGLGVT